uniref:Uncharacterized protein n=1 Tax=Glossina brevipalpis TaxID=37001 RepID=A0A1A9WNW7_9MUSC
MFQSSEDLRSNQYEIEKTNKLAILTINYRYVASICIALHISITLKLKMILIQSENKLNTSTHYYQYVIHEIECRECRTLDRSLNRCLRQHLHERACRTKGQDDLQELKPTLQLFRTCTKSLRLNIQM